MYLFLLSLHSILRWAVILTALWAIGRAWAGMTGRRAWEPRDDTAGQWFVTSMDLQLLIGLILYGVLSPITAAAFADMAGAMKNPIWRFWTVEHIMLMVVAVALTHVGRSRSRRAVEARSRHKSALVFYVLSLLLVLAAIPWPWMRDPRPLVRLFGF